MARDPLGLYDDAIVIPFEIPLSLGGDGRESERRQPAETAPDGFARLHPPDPPPSASAGRRRDATARAAEGSWPAPATRLIGVDVLDHPDLAVSGGSNSELTLWRRSTDTAPAEPLATFTLDPDGSQLFDGNTFVGFLYEGEGAARLHHDWLRSVTNYGVANPKPEGEDLPYDPHIQPVYPIEELVLGLAGGEIGGQVAWRILRRLFAAATKRLVR